MVDVEFADLIPNGWKHWMVSDLLWSERIGKSTDEAEMLALDEGRTLGLARMVGHRNERPAARLDTL